MLTPQQLAEQLETAYSTDRYRGGWLSCVKMLRKRGYSDREIEAIIRSKHTRWAGDASSSRYGYVNSADLARYIDKHSKDEWTKEVAELVAQTFG